VAGRTLNFGFAVKMMQFVKPLTEGKVSWEGMAYFSVKLKSLLWHQFELCPHKINPFVQLNPFVHKEHQSPFPKTTL